MEGNLLRSQCVLSSPPVEEYPKGEVVFCLKVPKYNYALSRPLRPSGHPSKESPTKFINFAGPDGGELSLFWKHCHCECNEAIQLIVLRSTYIASAGMNPSEAQDAARTQVRRRHIFKFYILKLYYGVTVSLIKTR